MKTGAVSLVLSAVALGVAVVAVARHESPAERAPVRMDRVAELERKVSDLTREVESLRARGQRRVVTDLPTRTPPVEAPDHARAAAPAAEGEEALAAIVDNAVDRKTKKVLDDLRAKANKKPAFAVFASVLELTDVQREATQRVVVEGQREVHEILRMPTLDGTNLMDELVEIVARNMAEPGKDPGWGPWFGRVVSEKIPGTGQTYGARIEAVKADMRARFKKDWSPEQYREFEEWGVDPTEIEQVPGSPNEKLMQRIAERAKQLGATLPDDG